MLLADLMYSKAMVPLFWLFLKCCSRISKCLVLAVIPSVRTCFSAGCPTYRSLINSVLISPVKTVYSASSLDRATRVCFFEAQDTAAPPRVKAYPPTLVCPVGVLPSFKLFVFEFEVLCFLGAAEHPLCCCENEKDYMRNQAWVR